MSSDPQEEILRAKRDILECEKQTAAIKSIMRGLGPEREDEKENSLTVTLIKVSGLPEAAQPSVSLQLSSPIEEATLTGIFSEDSPDAEGTVATFKGVETNQAILSVSARDADVVLGDGKDTIDVSQLTKMDSMNPQTEYASEVTVPIMAPDDPNKETAEPICRLYLKVVYVPSPKDQREDLYERLNTTTKKKADAGNRLRQATMAISRLPGKSTPSASSPSKPAVKPGFLNKKSPEPSWFSRNFGSESMIRRVFPVVKNYLIFAGVVGFFHFKGQTLALLPPV